MRDPFEAMVDDPHVSPAAMCEAAIECYAADGRSALGDDSAGGCKIDDRAEAHDEEGTQWG